MFLQPPHEIAVEPQLCSRINMPVYITDFSVYFWKLQRSPGYDRINYSSLDTFLKDNKTPPKIQVGKCSHAFKVMQYIEIKSGVKKLSTYTLLFFLPIKGIA